ncbi:hypothetical protein CYY_007053 [Polysphondylium violaceum]|uniref:Uncharacterized protein n=1 Tax=Polysphondylium violaceum TaxID=133409 RepID=A0A8J4V2K2_9MYCE|nr:hypothetical protein CYY_007053 [Polysphondylium violaceum]
MQIERQQVSQELVNEKQNSQSSSASTSASASPSNSRPSSPTSSWTPDIFGIITSLTNWLKGIENKEIDEQENKEKELELWRDWEWVLSVTEEFLLKQNQTENAKVLGELDTLKKTASNLKLKPLFINRAAQILNEYTTQDLNTLKLSMDSNKRLGVITTVINTLQPEWLEFIKENYFQEETNSSSIYNNDSPTIELAEEGWDDSTATTATNEKIDQETKELRTIDSSTSDMIVLNKNINKITWEQFNDNFKGSKYQKGIYGRMKDIGWQASHGVDGSLNSRVVGDITWSIWNTLNSAIKQIREPTMEESNDLIETICLLQPILIKTWVNTKKNSRIGAQNEGIVVEKWKTEESNRKKKILELKKSGQLDRYNPSKVKILDHERKEISSIRSNLEKKLKLRQKD